MSDDPQTYSTMLHLDVSASPPVPGSGAGDALHFQVVTLLQQLAEGQDRQNQLLEELVEQLSANQRQRATELGQWKRANPTLARGCRRAAEALSRVQAEFLQNLIDSVTDSAECLMDSDFMLNEFVDRYGPRLAHLNGVLQVLSQLSSVPNPAGSTQQ